MCAIGLSRREHHRLGDPEWRAKHRTRVAMAVSSPGDDVDIDTLPTQSLHRLTYSNLNFASASFLMDKEVRDAKIVVDPNDATQLSEAEFPKAVMQLVKQQPLFLRSGQEAPLSAEPSPPDAALLLHGNEVYLHLLHSTAASEKSLAKSPFFDDELLFDFAMQGDLPRTNRIFQREFDQVAAQHTLLYSDADEASANRLAPSAQGPAHPRLASLERSTRLIPTKTWQSALFDECAPSIDSVENISSDNVLMFTVFSFA